MCKQYVCMYVCIQMKRSVVTDVSVDVPSLLLAVAYSGRESVLMMMNFGDSMRTKGSQIPVTVP